MGIFAKVGRHHVGRFVVAAELVGETRVGVAAHRELRNTGDLLQKRSHLIAAQRAVDANGQGIDVYHRGVKRRRRLARERSPAQIGNRPRYHYGHTCVATIQFSHNRVEGSLAIERVENRLDQ